MVSAVVRLARDIEPHWGTGALRLWRAFTPSLSQESVCIAAACYLSLAFNASFARAVMSSGALHGLSGALSGASLVLMLVCLNCLLLLAVSSRWTLKPVLWILLPASAAAAYHMDRYGIYFDADMIRNILRTDPREASELMSAALILWTLVTGVVPALVLSRVRLIAVPRRPWLRRAAFIGAAALMLAGAAMVSFPGISALMRNHREIRHLVTPGNYLVSLARVAARDSRERNAPRVELGAGAHVTGRTTGQRPRLLVVVVGETVRARNWGLNGYERQTTPRLAARDVVNFPEVASCGTATEVSLPCMFSPYARSEYSRDKSRNSESLLHILQRSGMSVAWLDNQSGCKGVCTGIDTESFEHASDAGLCRDGTCLDGILLQALGSRIVRLPPSQDAVIVMHQLGNHGPAYSRRYPAQFRRFGPECLSSDLGRCSRAEIVNAYDNAVLYTDDLLDRTIGLLAQQSQRDTALIYISDHGESLGEGGLYLHGMPYAIAPQVQTHVPMIMWISSGFSGQRGISVSCMKAEAKSRPASHDNFFHTVLGLMGVSTPEYRPGLDLVEPCTRPAGTLADAGTASPRHGT